MALIRAALFIDDNELDTRVHSLVAQQTGLIAEIKSFGFAPDALEFLKTASRSPIDIIFLDFRMPEMNGFEFADEYLKLPDALKAKALYLMLTVPLSPTFQEQADNHPAIDGLVPKPLSRARLEAIISERFSSSDHGG